ncbi:hypothetical protein AC578_7157 [Pseudocercospora eumusae]|uniref:Arrestin-like N-terminal domain-containing protein n=1 Tax=Pseudocercospora eumusae TaxID=321146 RepID=A0A139HWT2_9PEZI|nr:hypothetical protein AC578_7157 [Pseudocercospora eumusae]
MSNAKLGRLNAQILIDDGFRIHYGPTDTVSGRIVLSYKPHSSLLKSNAPTADLFGPISIQGILRSKVRVKVRRGDSHRLPTDHSKILFEYVFDVFVGSFKATVGEDFSYPFAINLPQDLKDIYDPANGGYAELMSSGDSRDQLLPLTFSMHFVDHPDVVSVGVLHQIGAQVTMPGIDIKTDIPSGDDRPPIRLELPRPPRALVERNKTTFIQNARVQNEYLLPEEERPQGFKQKAKAVFTSSHFPEFVVDVQCTYQQYIHPGQQLTFEVVLRRNDRKSTAEVFPDATLEGFQCDLRAYTIVDVSNRLIGSPQCIDTRTVQILAGHSRLSKQLNKESDYSIAIMTDPVMQNVSSFAHQKVSRQYLLRIAMQLKLAKESVKVRKECPVILLPPPEDSGSDEALAGPSQSYIRPPPDDEYLPAYGEAGSSTFLSAG